MKRLLLAVLAVLLSMAVCGCDPGSTTSGVQPGGGTVRSELTGIPDEKLPFPRGQLKQVWEIDERYLLVEQESNQDNSFFLCDRSTGEVRCIVGFIENAEFEGAKDGKLTFLAKGDGDCGDFSFPYRLVYDLGSGKLPWREPLFLPVRQGVAFGSTGAWKQELCGLRPAGSEFVFEFKPRTGQVLAGGHRKPLTTVNFKASSGELVFRFYNVEPAPGLVQGRGIPVPGHVFVKEYRIETLTAGQDPDDPALFTRGFPYGLNLRDISKLKGLTSVRVSLKVDGNPLYSIVSPVYYRDGTMESTLKHIVSFQ